MGCRLAIIDRSAKRFISCCALTVAFTTTSLFEMLELQGQQILAFKQYQLDKYFELTLPLSGITQQGSQNSLLCRKESLLLRSKFPVPLSREFWF
jgi:hypothetical protein